MWSVTLAKESDQEFKRFQKLLYVTRIKVFQKSPERKAVLWVVNLELLNINYPVGIIYLFVPISIIISSVACIEFDIQLEVVKIDILWSS